MSPCAPGSNEPGRSIALLAAELSAGGRVVLRARAWRLAAGDTVAVATGQDDGALAPLPPPDEATLRTELPPGGCPDSSTRSNGAGCTAGWATQGPGTVWARQRVPLVDGEEPSPLQRLMLVADSGNGAAAPLDIREWLFLNTELTIHLHRLPVGAWMAVDAQTIVGPAGMGTVAGLLFDERGHVGRSAQCLTVRRRGENGS